MTRSRTRLVYLGKVANGRKGRYTLLQVYTTVLARYFTIQTGILDRSHTTGTSTHQASYYLDIHSYSLHLHAHPPLRPCGSVRVWRGEEGGTGASLPLSWMKHRMWG